MQLKKITTSKCPVKHSPDSPSAQPSCDHQGDQSRVPPRSTTGGTLRVALANAEPPESGSESPAPSVTASSFLERMIMDLHTRFQAVTRVEDRSPQRTASSRSTARTVPPAAPAQESWIWPPFRRPLVQPMPGTNAHAELAQSVDAIRDALVKEEPAFGPLEFSFDPLAGVLTVSGFLTSRYLHQQVTARALRLPAVRAVRNLVEVVESYPTW